MRSQLSAIAIVTVLALVAAAHPAAQGAKPAPVQQSVKLAWPPAVEGAFKKAYPNATIKAVSKEVANGKTIYEVESIDNGRRRDINYNPDGSLILYEEQLTEAEVPAVVMAAIKKRYPKATTTAWERLYTEKDKSSNFEIQMKGAPVSEAVLTPDGTWVSPKLK